MACPVTNIVLPEIFMKVLTSMCNEIVPPFQFRHENEKIAYTLQLL